MDLTSLLNTTIAESPLESSSKGNISHCDNKSSMSDRKSSMTDSKLSLAESAPQEAVATRVAHSAGTTDSNIVSSTVESN